MVCIVLLYDRTTLAEDQAENVRLREMADGKRVCF